MDIVLDSSVLLSDPWLRSHRLKSLIDYLSKTDSNLWLLEPVVAEVRGHVTREIREATRAIDSALAVGLRKRLRGLPQFVSEVSVAATLAGWEAHFENELRSVAIRLPFVEDVLPEAFQRAVDRVPPCSTAGEQLRDAIIWLTFLRHCKRLSSYGPIAFVSANTRDFAETEGGGRTFKSRLQADVQSNALNVLYYPTLDDFLRDHAEPVAHITPQWIDDHLAQDVVMTFLNTGLVALAESYLKPANSDLHSYFVPNGSPYVTDIDAHRDSFLVWRFDDGRIEIDLSYVAYIEADVDCEPIGHEIDATHTLSCYCEVGFHLIAGIENGSLILDRIEDIYAR